MIEKTDPLKTVEQEHTHTNTMSASMKLRERVNLPRCCKYHTHSGVPSITAAFHASCSALSLLFFALRFCGHLRACVSGLLLLSLPNSNSISPSYLNSFASTWPSRQAHKSCVLLRVLSRFLRTVAHNLQPEPLHCAHLLRSFVAHQHIPIRFVTAQQIALNLGTSFICAATV